jgi:methionyl-tRNA synthetase
MTTKRILVTSALPYANGPIHLGHLAGAYLPADIYVRYQRLKQRDVIYICGSDEHGVPITLAAEKQNKSPQEIVDVFHNRNLQAFERFGMSFDYYGRTSSPVHRQTSRDFFRTLHDKGILKQKTEKQYFDPKINMFLPDRYVKGTCPICSFPEAYGDQCEKCGSSLTVTELVNPKSTLTGESPVYRETEHWYLPLGDFQRRIETWLESKQNWKSNVMGQVRSWFQTGLGDRAVTRDLSWGVPVPLEGSEGKVLYVWFDAPIGYISATKEWSQKTGDPDRWTTYWQDPDTKLVHFIGKDNIVFHCIMFPAMLMAHGEFVLPDNVPANEFLNLEGDKLSTSRNYAVWLEKFLESFEADPLRYYLAINAPETKDADFTWKEFQQRNNGELADILGNFINRTMTFARKQFDNKVPEPGALDATDTDMLETLKNAPQTVGAFLEHYELRKAAAAMMDVGRAANKYFNDKEPWITAKSDRQTCATTIHICLQAAATLAVIMEPFLPFSALKLWTMLGQSSDIHQQTWDQAGESILPAGHALGTAKILFRKLEDTDIQPEIDKLKKNAPSTESEPKPVVPPKDEMTIETFAKIDLRIARVKEAEPVPKTDKLLKLTVEVGNETRQLVAGIAKHYGPDDLIGKRVVVVFNLKPAKLRGIESNGMVLAAEDDNGRLGLLTVDRDIETGAQIR